MLQPHRAEQIFNDYDAVLKSAAKQYGAVYPETLLGHTKLQIKEALKAHVGHLKSLKKMNEDMYAVMSMAYGSLGMFLAEEDAEFVKNYKKTQLTDAVQGFAEKTKRYQFITNKVRSQMEDYQQEFKVFYSKLMNDKMLGKKSE